MTEAVESISIVVSGELDIRETPRKMSRAERN
jgi:hypothetical protein